MRVSNGAGNSANAVNAAVDLPSLLGAVSVVVDAAAALRTRWIDLPRADIPAQLLELERKLASMITEVVRVSESLVQGQAGNGVGGRAATNGKPVSRLSTLGIDLVRLDRDAAARDRAAAALLWHEAANTQRLAACDRDRAALMRHAAAMDKAAAMVDALTGASGRQSGVAAIEREMARARRGDGRLVVGFIDVDGLKTINDTRGHAAGDTFLQHAVTVARSVMRSYDTVLRFGGDEFVYSLAGSTWKSAVARAKRIGKVFAELTDGGSLSFGLAGMEDGDTVATLIVRADADLYRSRGERRTQPV